MKVTAIFASVIIASSAISAQAQDEEEKKELQGYSVGSSNRPKINADDMKIEIERPTFDSGFRIETPKPSMSGIRMERPKLQVMQAPSQPATSPSPSTSTPAAGTATNSAGAAASTPTAGTGENRSIKPLQMNPPEYPRSALRRGEEGFVVVEFTISTDGSTRDVEVVESEPRGVFDREAERAVSRWKFEPALRDGRPVETRLQHTIDFNLTD